MGMNRIAIVLMVAALAACAGPAAATDRDSELPGPAGPQYEVAVTQYLIDTAGFHAIDVELEETGEIQPGYAGTVRRIQKLVDQTPWPEELRTDVEAFSQALAELRRALEDGDAERAVELAGRVHSAQHDLSHGIDGWLEAGEHEGASDGHGGEASDGHGD